MLNQKNQSKPGQGTVEYAIILALLVIVLVLVLNLLGVNLANVFNRVVTALGFQNIAAALLSDDYTDMTKWHTYSGNSWTNTNGQLCNTGGSHIVSTVGMPNNTHINVDNAQLTTGNGYGVMFRVNPSGSSYAGYSFQLDPGLGNKFVFRRYDLNGTELSSPLSTSSFPAGFDMYAPHQMAVDVQGSTFKAYVDGTLVLTATDSTYPSGNVGFRTWDSTAACMGHLTVTTP
jgi:Flp pilus assembly pilin Flp